MSTNDKLQTILMANSIYTMYAMMGFHTTMTVGTDECTHDVDVTVFWNDENQLRFIRDKSHGLLRDGDGYEEKLLNDDKLEGGWVAFNLKFK